MTMPVHKSPPDIINSTFVHKESVQTDPGDLVYLDSADSFKAKPASSFTDAGSAAATQRLFAGMFAGISLSQQLSSDSTARGARILTEVDVELACASSTFNPGDFVAPTYTAGVLSDQSVTKVTDRALAIGKVIKRYSSATTKVWVRLFAPQLRELSAILPASKFTTDATGTQTADAGDLTGANFVTWKNTANGAVALTTRTAAQMIADIPGAYIGQTFIVRIISAGDNTVTLTAGTGITITGTATVATAKFRDFQVTIDSATAMTFQDIGAGTT